MSDAEKTPEKDRTVYVNLESGTSRRQFLKRAAAAGLAMPVVAGGFRQVGAAQTAATPSPVASPVGTPVPIAGGQGQPQPGGTFVVLGHQEVPSLSP